MKYKISKGCYLFDKLMEVGRRMIECNAQARQMVRNIKGAGKFHIARNAIAGGISCIRFKEKPLGWVRYSRKYQGLYKPAAKNKIYHTLIGSLPVVESEEVAKLLKFKDQTYFVDDTMHWISCPGVRWKKNFILVSVPSEVKYKPLPGMKEILESEFIKLSKQK